MATVAPMPGVKKQHALAILIGARIARLRKGAGLSQQGLADELRCTRPSITQIESGWSFPTYEHLMRLSEIFGITPGDLLKPEVSPYTAIAPNVLKELLALSEDDACRFVRDLRRLLAVMETLPQTAI